MCRPILTEKGFRKEHWRSSLPRIEGKRKRGRSEGRAGGRAGGRASEMEGGRGGGREGGREGGRGRREREGGRGMERVV